MADSNSTIPRVSHQPPTINFLVPTLNDGIVTAPDALNTPSDTNDIPPRPDWANTNAMEFWNGIFPEAMSRFRLTVEPKGWSKTPYDIRDKCNWDAVYEVLEAASNKYQMEGGMVGWLRKTRRRVADNITPVAGAVKIASKFVPDNLYATPILCAVGVLLDAVKTAARVRNQTLGCFDGLIPIFSDVELFLGTFPRDNNIRNASVDLTITILVAIERVIGFFIRNEFAKGGKALLSGNDYEKSMLEAIEMINTKSRQLMKEAEKSHIHEFHMYSQETFKIHKQLLQTIGSGFKAINSLLTDHLHEKDQKLEEAQQENTYLRIENLILRAALPFQQSRQTRAPVIQWQMNQQALRRMLDTPDLDIADITFITEKKEQLPERQRVLTEQIIDTRLFRDWIVSPSSAKLLVQWDFSLPETIAGVSPLSIFCMTIAKSLRETERFLSALWFCGRHVDAAEANGRVGGRAMLTSLIDQLLRHHAFDTRFLQNDVDLTGLQGGNLDTLIKVFSWLVRQLPPTITLFCMVDGVALFEREEFEGEALQVFSSLLRLVGDASVSATVKVLFTSTPGTEIVRAPFEDDDLILEVSALPQLVWAASEERMINGMIGHFEDLR